VIVGRLVPAGTGYVNKKFLNEARERDKSIADQTVSTKEA